MPRLYRKHGYLPSLPGVLLVVLSGCSETGNHQAQNAETDLSNPQLRALQDAEAVRYQLEQRLLDQQRVDELIGRDSQPARR